MRSLAARLGLAALAVSAAWLGAAWWARAGAADPFDAAIWREPVPYVGYGECRGDWSRPKAPGEFLIVMSGGSTVYGFQGKPLPALLQRELRRDGYRRVRVLNCGVLGQNSSQELARLVFRIADLEPDLLIVYDGGNDIFNPLSNDPRPGYPHNFIVTESNPLLRPGQASWAALAAMKSPLARRFLGRRLLAVRRDAGYGSSRWREELARVYARNAVKTAAISRAFGIRSVLVLQPLLCDKKPLTDYERGVEGLFERLDISGGLSWRSQALDVQGRIRRLEARRAFGPWPEFWDFSAVLDGQGGAFQDYIHLTDFGNAVVAEALVRRMKAERMLP